MRERFFNHYTVVSPTEPEVTIAHTKIFLARGWEIDETGGAQDFHCNLSLLFWHPASYQQNNDLLYTREHWPSFFRSDNTVTYNLPGFTVYRENNTPTSV